MTQDTDEFSRAGLLSALKLLAIGLAGGLIAAAIGTPLPFMLGALVAVALAVTVGQRVLTVPTTFPHRIRTGFIAVIGVMIGGTFNLSLFAEGGSLVLTGLGVALFVPLAFWANYQILTRIGGFDRMTAFCAGMPGGLIESIAFAEQSNADLRVVTTQQFLRITLLVSGLPLLFSLYAGEAVGSAAGISLAAPAGTLVDWLILLASGVVGYFGGRALRLPAFMVVGPMIASAIVHVTGWTDAGIPAWLIAVSQLVIGTGLGTRFAGVDAQLMRRIFGLGLLSLGAMLSIGIAIAAALSVLTPYPLPVLALCFAAGGLIEMALIALSLNANPVFVTGHHILRIILTVVVASTLFERIKSASELPSR